MFPFPFPAVRRQVLILSRLRAGGQHRSDELIPGAATAAEPVYLALMSDGRFPN